MAQHVKHISVCICTFKRLPLLTRLLEQLASQDVEQAFTYSIVVADNDHMQSAKKAVTEFASRSLIDTVYCVEPRQNIARARNKALEHSKGDFIAFIDDDEFPARDWLATLFKTCNDYGVDGVLGPVKPHFEVQPPEWVKRGKFYERPTHDTGFGIDWDEGRTGNVLFRRGILDDSMETFRPEFGSGSEDTDFFRRMILKGHVFIWCNEAVVYETVHPVRWKRSFMLRRALLRGKNSLKHPTGRMRAVAKSAVAIPVYFIALPFLLLRGQHEFMKYLIKLCDHTGRLLAILHWNRTAEVYVTEQSPQPKSRPNPEKSQGDIHFVS